MNKHYVLGLRKTENAKIFIVNKTFRKMYGREGMQVFEYNFLKYAENDKQSLKLIKENYESCFRNDINTKKVFILSIGVMIVVFVEVFLLYLILIC